MLSVHACVPLLKPYLFPKLITSFHCSVNVISLHLVLLVSYKKKVNYQSMWHGYG
jgi:hypothetical protein